MTTKNYGLSTSGYLDPSGRAFENLVFEAGKPVLDKELNLGADIESGFTQAHLKRASASGWLSDDFINTFVPALRLFTPSILPNNISTPPLTALINGWQIPVVNTNANGSNLLDLGAGPVGNGARRTDLVILEVWRKLISPSPSTDGKSQTARIWLNGNVKVSAIDDPTINPPDDILDGVVLAETTKRVQVQYRLRVIRGIDLFAYPTGIEDPSVLANSTPANALAPDGVATAFGYTNQSTNGDPGLWVAGNGIPSNTLNTVDGYMYAIPLLGVFRRNTTGFDRNLNQNGGVATPGPSDRPDGLFYDVIDIRDIVDLRRGVSVTGFNYEEVLDKNFTALLDNSTQTEWTQIGIGGGTDGHTLLAADEIGVSNANGGDGVTTGDTPGANFIDQFDYTRRRFSDRVIYEVMTVQYTPGGAGVSTATWQNGTVITINPTALAPYPFAPFNFPAYAPSQTRIVDVIGMRIEGTAGPAKSVNVGTPRETGTSYLPVTSITGLGVFPISNVVITTGDPAPFTLTTEPIYIDLLIAYPPATGLTYTPTKDFGSASFTINNPANLPAAPPTNFAAVANEMFDPPHREINLQYTTTSLVFSFAADTTGPRTFYDLPERASAATVTVNSVPQVATLSADGRVINIPSGTLSGDSVVVTYTALRPIPQTQVQFTIYYEARAPQTVRTNLLGTTQQLIPRYISPYIYTLTTGPGSIEAGYPFPMAYVQSGGVSSPTLPFSGDAQLNGSANVFVSDFNANVGMLKLPAYVPYTPDPSGVVFQRLLGDIDPENRTFFKTVPTSAYIPNAFAHPLSDARTHKVLLPCLMETTVDTPLAPKGSLVLVLLSRWAPLDNENSVRFNMTTPSDNTTTASIYRINGNLLNRRA